MPPLLCLPSYSLRCFTGSRYSVTSCPKRAWGYLIASRSWPLARVPLWRGALSHNERHDDTDKRHSRRGETIPYRVKLPPEFF